MRRLLYWAAIVVIGCAFADRWMVEYVEGVGQPHMEVQR